MKTPQALIIGYTAQLYTAILGIVFVPLYLHYLGIEAFGLIGFSLMLQGIIQLLDMGLGQTLMRETSRSRVDTSLQAATYGLLLTGERLFLILGLTLTLISLMTLPWIISHWLKVENLPESIISSSVLLAIGLAGLRLYSNFYRSGLLGYGLQEWTNVIGACFATLRYLGSIPILAYTHFGIVGLFTFQLIISIIELLVYRWRLSHLSRPKAQNLPNTLTLLRQHYRILGSLAVVSWLWTAMTQLDKVLLSHWLALGDYGLFSLAITAAGVISLISAPIGQLLQPRFNILAASNNRPVLLNLYSYTTQRLTFFFIGTGSVLAFFAEPILTLWTGNVLHAKQVAPIFFWYVLGNATSALLVLPFMLQYAMGNLRLHLIGNLIFAALWLPALVWAGYSMGGIGTGITWFIGNTLFLLGWTSYTHASLFPELPKAWILKNIAGIAIPTIAITYALSFILMPYIYF